MIQIIILFHIGMKARARGVIICFIVCFHTTYFYCGRSMGTGEEAGVWVLVWSILKNIFSFAEFHDYNMCLCT